MGNETVDNRKTGIRWLQLLVLLLLLAVLAAVIMWVQYQQFRDSALAIPEQELLYTV